MTQILIEKILPNPDQPRKTFRKETLQELGQSIKRHGLVQPIVVEREGDGYVLITGERRWRACQAIGKKSLEVGREVIVQDRTNHNGRERMLSAVIENVQREDMNPIDEGQAYRSLIDEHGMRPSEISIRIGKSVTHVMNCLERLKLPKEIQDMMREGTILADLRLVSAFLSLPDRKLATSLAQRAAERNMTIKGVVVAARRLKEAVEAEPLSGKGTPALRIASRRARIPFDETQAPPRYNAVVYMGKAPRWELVAKSAGETCANCELRSMASAATCGRCPLVAMLTELAREAK